MKFQTIAESVSVTPRHPSGRLLLGEGTLEWLFGSAARAWFKSCRAWIQGEPGPDDQPLLSELLANLDPFWQNLARAHLDCARLLQGGRRAAQISTGEIEALAVAANVTTGFLRDLLLEMETPPDKLLQDSGILTGQCRPPERSLSLTALLAGWRGQERESNGFIADLQLELIPHGRGDCYPVPAQQFLMRERGVREAERCAIEYLKGQGLWPEAYDLRWRLARRDQQTLTGLSQAAPLAPSFALGIHKLLGVESGPLRGFCRLGLTGVAVGAELDVDGSLKPMSPGFAAVLPALSSRTVPRIHTVIAGGADPIQLPGFETDSRQPGILIAPREDIHIVSAPTLPCAVERLLFDQETRWHGIDCQLPPQDPDFVGRDALFQFVRDWLERTDCGYLVLEGDMGLGKTAFMAALLHERRKAGDMPVFHLINSPHAGTSEQIASCLYARLRRKHGLLELPEWAQLQTEQKLERCLTFLSERLQAAGGKEVIFLDAVDQVELPGHQPFVPGVLARLPPRVLCVISSRFGVPWVHGQVEVCRMADLVNDQADVRTYLRKKFPATTLSEEFIEEIVSQKPLPVFFTVVSCVRKLQDKYGTAQARRELLTTPSVWNMHPRELIVEALERGRAQALAEGISQDEFWTALGLVAVAQEPLTRSQFEALNLLNPPRRHVLDRCASLFHLPPTLKDPHQPYVFSHPGYGREIIDRLTGQIGRLCHQLFAQGCEAVRARGQGPAWLYATRHWTTHLQSAGELDLLAHVLSDFSFLEEYLGSDSQGRTVRPGRMSAPPPATVFDLLREFQRALSALLVHPMRPDLWALSQLLDEHSHLLHKDPSLLLQLAWNELGNALHVSAALRDRVAEALRQSPRAWLKLIRQSAHAKSPLIRTLRHDAAVTCVAFSSDTNLLASGSKDRTVRLWEMQTGECRGTLCGHQNGVTALAISHNGVWLASVGLDDRICIWRIASGTLARTIKAGAGGLHSVVFSGDDRVLVTGGANGWVQFWDPYTGLLRRQRNEHGAAVKALAVCPRGQFVASGGEDCTIRIWALPDGEWQRTLRGHETWVESLAFTHDGKALVSGGGINKGEIRFWDALTGDFLRMLPGHLGGVCSLAFSPDGFKLASGSYDRTVLVRYVSTGAWLTPMHHGEKVECVAFSPDGRYLATGSDDYTVRIWDTSGSPQIPQQTASLETTGVTDEPAIHCLALSRTGATAVSGGHNCLVKLWDVERGCLKGVLSGHLRDITCVAIAPDDQTIASGSLHEVRQWSVQLAALSPVLRGHRSWVLAADYSDDGRFMVTGGDDGQVMLWEASSGAWLHTLPANQGTVHTVAFSPNTDWVASGGSTGTINVWDFPARIILRTIPAHDGAVTSLEFGPPGTTLIASGGPDECIRLWDFATGQALPLIRAGGGKITALAFSADARWLASGCSDFTVKVWDVQTGELLAWMPCVDTVLALRWVADQPLLQIADAGGALHVPHFYLMQLVVRAA